MRNNIDDLTLSICSGGGDINAGVGSYHFLRVLPLPIKTRSPGLCGSIAATIYLVSNQQAAAPASIFSLHAATFIESLRIGQVSKYTHIISAPFRSQLGW